jgi:hypothetical protein
MFSRSPGRSAGWIVSALFALCVVSMPHSAHAVSADSALGVPQMFAVTGKIPPPFQFRFDLGVAVSSWPPLVDAVSLGPSDMNAFGQIEDNRVFDRAGPPYNNEVHVYATTRGTYATFADMTDFLTLAPYVPEPYVGTFAYTQWSQSFVKDSLTSTCSFTSSYSALRARSVAMDTGRAENALYGVVTSGNSTLDQFSQKEGLLAWTPNATGPTNFATWFMGPMPVPAPTDPSGAGVARQYVFAPLLAVGDTFTVTMQLMSQAAIGWGELPGARATFTDPVTGTGIQFAKHACTPVDGLPVVLGVPARPPAGVAGLSPPWPNPSRGTVSFTLELPRGGPLDVRVYDLAGREVATVADGEFAAGTHVLQWNPAGNRVAPPAGVYFVRASAPGLQATRRVVRLGE